ncbi:unnamed protein product [Spodoptera littoralis]|uniref:GON-4-like protein n=1 Tax=Spodoptera littoralis TaxID=7109 RepID=A0A9P0N5A5_SPOLI|nr:unnamed protein product [Spodoptera littoralis]CAH1640405.1 unnamed protein product [Spodoptera littoralis]
MNKSGQSTKSGPNESATKDNNSVKTKGKVRGKKRKRSSSESSSEPSSEHEVVLPENAADVDRSLHAVALKNNLDETSVRKIIKKVVTNDRVLALVKMREEEDSGSEELPKLTRAKVKELMKVSPKTTTTWNLENLELTPIKHIPVKTRPEVKALIAQELPEDEDDEEYEPTHDDVPSDDDQGLESCSDLDSQPRTPATPHSQHAASPKVVKDGPFKVPQDITTPARRKLDLEEEATIALRTRSKLSLSSTSIEHIERNFVPPDDIPMPAVDDLWNQFLNECLNPASTSKNEDDDETDPEYNVAADPDAQDEDEEALGQSIIKISKKELNDLITELFNVMPEPTADEVLMADNLSNGVFTDHSQGAMSGRWEGKQEPHSDDDSTNRQKLSDKITFEKKKYCKVSIGKKEPMQSETGDKAKPKNVNIAPKPTGEMILNASIEEVEIPILSASAPLLLKKNLKTVQRTEVIQIHIQPGECVLPEQVQLLQQQLRQHVQLAASSFLQLYVHPIHWGYAAKYREYLETFSKMVDSNPKSVANVCNLKPALDLVNTWQTTMSENTPENREMIEFIQKQCERSRHRCLNKKLYVGEFHETFLKVVSNSPVFLYPYLLPAMPFRGEHSSKRFCYLYSEDALIALGLEQFHSTVKSSVARRAGRAGLAAALRLLARHLLPWLPPAQLLAHVNYVRRAQDKDNPIYQYLTTGIVRPVQHKLLPFSPQMSLYEHPEHEVPRIWLRYLAKTSKRFRSYLMKRTQTTGVPAAGVEINLGHVLTPPTKEPLPIDFTNKIVTNCAGDNATLAPPQEKYDIQITQKSDEPKLYNHLYKFMETNTGPCLVLIPSTTSTYTVNSIQSVATTAEINPNPTTAPSRSIQRREVPDHCTCCIMLRKICKQRQTHITEYFGKKMQPKCDCKNKEYPKVSNKLKLLVKAMKYTRFHAMQVLQYKLQSLLQAKDKNIQLDCDNSYNDIDDVVAATKFQLNLLIRTSVARNPSIKRKVYKLIYKFNLNESDPVELAINMDKVLGSELLDLYKEFVGFLTPEQADRINAFKDYFISNCLMKLVEKVEEQVADLETRHTILTEINKVFVKSLSTACEICTGILGTLHGHPDLARHVYSLFPHRNDTSDEPTLPAQTDPSLPANTTPEETMREDSMVAENNTTNYEADQSMSDQDDNCDNTSVPELNSNVIRHIPIKIESEETTQYVTPTSENQNVALVVTVSKTEVQDFNDSSNSSIRLSYDEGGVKIERPEWKRDEDKLILEILKEHLSPEERQDKTILEIFNEKDIVNLIAESLTDKTKDEITTRMLYLLQLC